MNAVIGTTELLLQTDLTSHQLELAETVRSSGEGLLTIINDLLDFSKIEAGKLRLESIDFDLRATTEDVCDLLAAEAYRKGLELVCCVDDELPQAVLGDPGRWKGLASKVDPREVSGSGYNQWTAWRRCQALSGASG